MPADETDATPAAAEPSRLDDKIETWFREWFHREPIATNTQHLNHCRAAADDLKRKLAATS